MKMNMINTTLCYLEKDGAYLMLHRIKKENDINKDKWVGIGGKFEEGESPEDCLKREVFEETGLTLRSARFRGIVTFLSDEYGSEYMHLFTSDDFTGELQECSEGEPVWIPKEQVEGLNIWEGDKIFFRLMNDDCGFFSLKLHYHGDQLLEHCIYIYS